MPRRPSYSIVFTEEVEYRFHADNRETEMSDARQAASNATGDSGIISSEEPIVLQNNVCVYCLSPLERGKKTREHVIGRRFVPEGKIRNSWNLLVYACHRCNNEKSRLEDEISAISMQPDIFGRYPDDSEDLIRDGMRKGRGSISTLTKKKIAESMSSSEASFSLSVGMTAEFTFEGPPQVSDERVAGLAAFHIKALFFWLTYNKEKRRGAAIPSALTLLLVSRRADWGNALNVAFMNHIASWPHRFLTDSNVASGYFKIALRRHPSEACWAWALEWNRQLRTIGFFGDASVVQRLVSNLPNLEIQIIAGTRETGFGMRLDVPLDPEDDHLFTIPFPESSEEQT
jgi:hypothetical protein